MSSDEDTTDPLQDRGQGQDLLPGLGPDPGLLTVDQGLGPGLKVARVGVLAGADHRPGQDQDQDLLLEIVIVEECVLFLFLLLLCCIVEQQLSSGLHPSFGLSPFSVTNLLDR